MNIQAIPVGENPPYDINVIIEIPARCGPVKYEIDKDSGALWVDRELTTAMVYPCNYGFVPHTLCGDGDPLDVLVVTAQPLLPGSVIRSRAVGMLVMEDESGLDNKILAVPISKVTAAYDHIQDISDFSDDFLQTISHFFGHYKDHAKGKWVKIQGWQGFDLAKQEVLQSVIQFKEQASSAE